MRYSFAFLSGLLLLTGCGQPAVTITYHQTGACNGGQGQSGDPSTSYNAGPHAAFVVFGIERIDNSQGKVPFNFVPTKLFVNACPRAFVDPTLMIYKWILGPFATAPLTEAPGKSANFPGTSQSALVVQTGGEDGAKEANMTN